MLNEMGIKARQAARVLAVTSADAKNHALELMAQALISGMDSVLAANDKDIENGKAAGLSAALLDRLRLTPERIEGMATGIRKVAALADPCGEVIDGGVRTAGLNIRRVRVPLGVVGIICEARPNVTSDAAALCLKSGNACILRSGKEAINSNIAVTALLKEALQRACLPIDSFQLVTDTSRDSANELMRLRALDVLIPRGGAGLIRSVVENASVPVIETGAGNCHVYVDKAADINMAADIVFNAKTSRPSVCNAMETLLVHRDIAAAALPVIYDRLCERNVEVRGCDITRAILGSKIVPVTDEDYATEFGDYILACRVVDSLDDAVSHISKYSTGHSECIVTDSVGTANEFVARIDCAAVYVNASTRFTDGEVFGLGAEIGISTQKLHARGPMGLRELTSMKYIVEGTGQIR